MTQPRRDLFQYLSIFDFSPCLDCSSAICSTCPHIAPSARIVFLYVCLYACLTCYLSFCSLVCLLGWLSVSLFCFFCVFVVSRCELFAHKRHSFLSVKTVSTPTLHTQFFRVVLSWLRYSIITVAHM